MFALNDARIDASEVVELRGSDRRLALRVRLPWTEMALFHVWPSTVWFRWEHLDDPQGALRARLVEWAARPSEKGCGVADVMIVLEMAKLQ